jgi:spore germination protein GerM
MANKWILALGITAVIGIGAFAAVALTSDDPMTDRPLQPTPTESPEPSRSPEPEEPPTVRVPLTESELWFVQDERLSWGTAAVGGQLSGDLATDDPVAQKAAFWLQLLVGGPQGPFEEAGDETAIPEGTKLLAVSRAGSVLKVDLSSRFESGGGSLSMQLRVAQVVYTGTQFEGVNAVRILIEGKRVDAIGGEGIVVAEPLTRRDFQDFAPFIVVETPKLGEKISSPVTVAGFANVFEANVNIRIRDKNGKVLVETFTTATCGNGCWGDFSEQVAFEVDERQEGRLEVLTYSAEDGSERDLVSIPVILVP